MLAASYLAFGGVIGSEFLPHLDEGALWVRGTLAPSTGPSEGIRVANQARIVLCSFPEVPQCTSQVGRPDDGTDTTGFFNTEYFVDLKPKEEWRPVFHQNKDELIAAMNRELEKIPGVVWGFSQPIEDNMEEAVSGVKGELATKVYGDDLNVLEEKADQIVDVMRRIKGIEDLGVFRALGQPNINFEVDRDAGRALSDQRRRHPGRHPNRGGRNRSHTGAAGRGALRPGAALPCRSTARRKKPSKTSGCCPLPASAFRSLSFARSKNATADRKSIARRTSATWRSSTACAAATSAARSRKPCSKVNAQVQLPRGYHIDWEGEYESEKRARRRAC